MFFKDNYYFLSNMYPCKVKVELDGNIYEFKCAESAYQACKCPERFKEFIELAIQYNNPIKIFNYTTQHFIKNPKFS